MKVLVVDDSALMRRLLGTVLSEAGLQVRFSRHGREALEMLTSWQPDVVTMDVNMPEMDGLTALAMLMQARPTPVVMVSSLTERGAQATLEALALGAVDFIAKPGGTISLNIDQIAQTLVEKVRAAARARVPAPRVSAPPAAAPSRVRASPSPTPRATAPGVSDERPAGPRPAEGVVVIGVSTGGPRTLEDILPQLPADFPWPVLVAQHMPVNFTDAFARRMDALCALRVRECSAAMPLEPGLVVVGKGGTDMVVQRRLGRLVAEARTESPAHPWHPSVDVLMDSVLRVLSPPSVVGVLLTGMGDDGAASLTRLRQQGGRTIAESRDTAVVFGMPQELVKRGGAGVVLPCHAIARQLCGWLHTERASA
jgi:two-component system chemotaxis response regulator CheB